MPDATTSKENVEVKSKVQANQESSDKEEAPDSQIGNINIYNHNEGQEGWSSPYKTSPNPKTAPLGATNFQKQWPQNACLIPVILSLFLVIKDKYSLRKFEVIIPHCEVPGNTLSRGGGGEVSTIKIYKGKTV